MAYIFFIHPFKLPYLLYNIWWELVHKLSIINCFPSTFYPILGHHQGCVYSKSDVTFACTFQLVRMSVYTDVLSSVYFIVVMPQTILSQRHRRCALSATDTQKPEEKDARGVICFMEENVISPREVVRFNEHIRN